VPDGADAKRSSRRLTWDPDAYLDSLEPIGWRLGLERMHRLTTALGMPQHRFASIHVVGTNGKSSVARMTAALLEAHGVGSGACLSPHAAHWAERTLIHGEEVGAEAWAAAVEQVARAAEGVNRSLAEGDAVTQFEAATAATFVALASARVEAAAIEAGLGGRLDATNTIPSRVTVLTSIGLDHTDWLGETELEIAGEKLAVLRDQTTLVLGRVSPEVEALAERTAAERGARLLRAPEDPGPELQLLAPGGFQRRNFALARTAAEAFVGELDRELVARVAATVAVPGRLERIAAQPPTFLDAAHNPDGAAALAEALPGVSGGRRVVGCLAILADKDAAAMVRALAPALERAICTELPADGPKSCAQRNFSAHRPSVPAGELARACEEAGLPAEAEPDFEAALRRASELASAEPEGVVLVAGSHYGIAPARLALTGG
jgi:dihydrofolate synthase / folylpolyglutamate synthase